MFRSNIEDRDDAIASMGEEEFYSIEGNERYREISPPKCFSWIYGVFMELREMSAETITFQDIGAWERARMTKLRQHDISLIRAMQGWAGDEIRKLRENSKDG